MNLFALVDRDHEAGNWPPALRAAVASQISLFASRTANTQALAIAPRLLELVDDQPTTERLLQAVQRQSAELPRCLLIASPLSLSALAARLQRRIDVDADGDDMMLRFWDSRIFLSLHRHLQRPTRDAFLAFGVQALVADRRGGLLPVALACPDGDPLQDQPCRLTGDDIKALGTAARPDAMLGMLRQQNPEALVEVPDADRHGLAVRQLEQCRQRKLQSPRDQTLALSLAIEHGADWWDQEQWAACLQEATTSTLLKAYLQHLEVA